VLSFSYYIIAPWSIYTWFKLRKFLQLLNAYFSKITDFLRF